jgi:signal transduction histidine kinase
MNSLFLTGLFPMAELNPSPVKPKPQIWANHLEMIFDAIPESLTIYSQEGRLLHANQKARELFALNRYPEVSSLKLSELARFLDVRDEVGRLLPPDRWTLARILRGVSIPEDRAARVRIRTLDGCDLLLCESGAPLYDERQQLIGAFLLSKPVKAAEGPRDDFIAMVAHELRVPLTSLLGYTEMLKWQTSGDQGAKLAEWQIEALETIALDVVRLVDLTNDLLDVSQVETGPPALYRSYTDLIALAHRVVTRMRARAKLTTISAHTAPLHLMVPIDVQGIERVLTNLITNAVKYSLEGSEVLVTIEEDQESGVAIISVRDQGIGIPKNQQSRIFSRFFRADNAKALGVEGTGLGLYLCRALVERHKGDIWFESIEGKGTTFYVVLPLATECP